MSVPKILIQISFFMLSAVLKFVEPPDKRQKEREVERKEEGEGAHSIGDVSAWRHKSATLVRKMNRRTLGF